MPENVDIDFLRAFKKIIEERVAAGETFAIIVGGGKVARAYMAAGRELAQLSPSHVDWIGIYVTRLNAEFMRIDGKSRAVDTGSMSLSAMSMRIDTKPTAVVADSERTLAAA